MYYVPVTALKKKLAFIFILSMWVFCLPYVCVPYGHRRPEEGIEFPRTEATDSCGYLGSKWGLLEEQPMIITTEPSFQPPTSCFLVNILFNSIHKMLRLSSYDANTLSTVPCDLDKQEGIRREKEYLYTYLDPSSPPRVGQAPRPLQDKRTCICHDTAQSEQPLKAAWAQAV